MEIIRRNSLDPLKDKNQNLIESKTNTDTSKSVKSIKSTRKKDIMPTTILSSIEREINDLLQDDELDDDDMKNNNPENNKKKRLPKCPQCSGTGKYMWKGNHFTLSFT